MLEGVVAQMRPELDPVLAHVCDAKSGHPKLLTASSVDPAALPHPLLYLILKEVFWYELPRTLRGLVEGVRRLYLPSGAMNQVYDTKNRVVKA